MNEKLKAGAHVILVDSVGKRHDGLITIVHSGGLSAEDYKAKYGMVPCINAVFVSDDASRTDSYGQQIERFTSFPHRSAQPVTHGFFYLFPDEKA